MSPELKPGKTYQYTLKAEIVRDGKTVKAERVVDVKAGKVTPVKFTLPAVGVATRNRCCSAACGLADLQAASG